MTISAHLFIARAQLVTSLLLSIAVLSGCASEPGPISQRQVSFGVARDEIHSTSVYELLGRPSEFDGQPVRVIGVAQFGFGLEEDSRIYATPEDLRHATNGYIGISSLASELAAPHGELEKLTGTFVIVEGIFHARPLHKIPQVPGSNSICVSDCRTSGSLEAVNRVSAWEL